MIRKFIFLLIVLLCPGVTFAQKTKKVRTTYVYVLPKNVSEEEGREIALQRAKQKAIDDEFGTIISQTNITRTESHNGEVSTDFSSLGQSLSKGEWIETIGTPEIIVSREQDETVITCKVVGRIREYKTAQVKFEAKVLRDETASKDMSDFNDGDPLFLSFQSPVDGYVAVYLVDVQKRALCLLPKASDSDGKEPVVHGVQYMYFSSQAPKDDSIIVDVSDVSDEIRLYCDEKIEINDIYILFSPNPFTKVVDYYDERTGMRSLSQEAFLKWLAECQRVDSQMSVEIKRIIIKK